MISSEHFGEGYIPEAGSQVELREKNIEIHTLTDKQGYIVTFNGNSVEISEKEGILMKLALQKRFKNPEHLIDTLTDQYNAVNSTQLIELSKQEKQSVRNLAHKLKSKLAKVGLVIIFSSRAYQIYVENK